MSTREEFDVAFEIITDGDRAEVSDSWKEKLFGKNWKRAMRAIQEKHSGWINTRPVQALGVGYRSYNGEKTDELAIVVYVDHKQPRNDVRRLVPDYVSITGLGRFPTDVVAIGRLRTHEFTKKVRPAMPGCSIGHRNLEGFGTFGLLVKKKDDEGSNLYILSNSHILALDGFADEGDDVVQPASWDVDGTSGAIAKLHKWEPFDFTEQYWPNLIDAAIARVVRAGSNVKSAIRDIKVTPAAANFQITDGMRVHKVGRTTGHMDSRVINPNVKLRAEHLNANAAPALVRYRRQVLCNPFGEGGDSGSIVLNERDEVVGLYAGGTEGGCWFNRIEHVFNLLQIELPT
jgi:hypothetical protein